MEESFSRKFRASIKRNRSRLLRLFTIISLAGLAAAYFWPSYYRSAATLLLESAAVPGDPGGESLAANAGGRIQSIGRRVLTRQNLQSVIDRVAPYPDSRDGAGGETRLERLRGAIDLKTLGAEIVPAQAGSPPSASIVFSIAFHGPDPARAQAVTQALCELFLEENNRGRPAQQPHETLAFLHEETVRMGDEVAALEARVAEFRAAHRDSLPERKQINLNLMDRAERQLLDIENRIRQRDDQKSPVRPDIGVPDQTRGAPGQEARLKALTSDYLGLLTRYSDRHPDVVNIRREIDVLNAERDQSGASDPFGEAAGSNASNGGSQFQPDRNPVRQRAALAESRPERSARENGRITPEAPQNPTVPAVGVQGDGRDEEWANLQALRDGQRRRVAELRARLQESPAVERDYLALMRDYDDAVLRHRTLKTRELDASLSDRLEQTRRTEQFSVIDPAFLPDQAAGPDRTVLAAAALLFGLTAALAWVLTTDWLDDSLRGSQAVVRAAGVVPLALIPGFITEYDRAERRRRRMAWAVTATGGLLLGLVLTHFLWRPLDTVWLDGLERMASLFH